MKKQKIKQKSLKLEKFNISKLSNLNTIKGGDGGGETKNPLSTIKCVRR